MNIKNKPVIQMSQKDQIIVNLKREIELFKMENKWLKQQLHKISGGEFEIESSQNSFRKQGLPPLGDADTNLNNGNDIQFERVNTRSNPMGQSQQVPIG